MWQGWSKNLYLLYGRKLWPMLKALGAAIGLDVFSRLGLLAMGIVIVAGERTLWPLLGLVVCYVAAVLRQWKYGKRLARLGFHPRLDAYQFAGAGLFAMLLLNSMWAYGVGGGVRWKGRRYQTSGQGRGEA